MPVIELANIFSAKGTMPKDAPAPRRSPAGIPMRESLSACRRTSRLICREDAPIVFSIP